MEAEQLKLLARSITPIDEIATGGGGGEIAITIEEPSAAVSVANLLAKVRQEARRPGKDVVYIRPFSRDMDTECEIKVGEDFVINPQIKSALKSLGGVLTVEDI